MISMLYYPKLPTHISWNGQWNSLFTSYKQDNQETPFRNLSYPKLPSPRLFPAPTTSRSEPPPSSTAWISRQYWQVANYFISTIYLAEGLRESNLLQLQTRRASHKYSAADKAVLQRMRHIKKIWEIKPPPSDTQTTMAWTPWLSGLWPGPDRPLAHSSTNHTCIFIMDPLVSKN